MLNLQGRTSNWWFSNQMEVLGSLHTLVNCLFSNQKEVPSMFPFLFSLFPQFPAKFRLLAFVLVLLTGLALAFFWQEPLEAKFSVFVIMATLVVFTVWKLLRK